MNQKVVFAGLVMVSVLFPLKAENGLKVVTPEKDGVIRNGEVSQWGAFLQLQSELKQDQLYRLTGEIRSLSGGVQEYTLSLRSSARNNDRGTAGTEFAPFCWYLRPEKTGSAAMLIGNSHSKKPDLEFRNLSIAPFQEEEWTKNLFPDSEFELSAGTPSSWRKTGDGDAYGQIVKSDFIGGEKSLELKSGTRAGALETMRLPFRTGHTYRLSFWAKAEDPVVLSLMFHVWKNGVKHFVRPFSCRPGKEWKEYAFEVDLPESLTAEYPSLKDGFARLMLRLPAGGKRVLLDRIILKEIK